MKNKLRHLYYRARFHLAPYLPLSFATHVDIELAGKCQLRCVMCPFGDHEDGTGSFDHQGMMPRDMAEKALREARSNGALSVKLNFRGEPGLSPYLIDMVRLAKGLGYVEVMLNTNLTAFSQRRLRELCEAGLDKLIVSVDGATKETYEAIRINGDFDRLCANLADLQGRTHIRIQMTAQDKNRHEVALMQEKFGPLCDELTFNSVRSDNSGERKQCPQPWQRLVVMWDGQVGACCSNWENEAVIGRYPDQSLKQIWQSQKRKDLLHFARDPNRGGPCQGCLVGGGYK